MKVTGQQYLDIHPDVKAAGMDPLFHYLTYGQSEGRQVDIPELPPDWNWQVYVNAYLDLQQAGIDTQAEAESHYLNYGYFEHRWPVPQQGWKPPTQSGEICRLPGPFFMSGLRVPEGLLLGTYRPAKLYLYDGTFKEEFSGSYESVYMIQNTPTGPIFSTERPAGIWKKKDGVWQKMMERPEIDSLGFDIWPYKGGFLFYTASNVNRNNVTTYLGDANGENWRPYKYHSGWYMPQLCTDGNEYWLVGSKDRLPYIQHENGAQTLWMKDYKDQEINYASVKDGLFTLGLNNIDPLISDGTRRNGYVMWGTTSGVYHSGIDLKPPYVMQTDIFDGKRYAIASIWSEGGYPNPQLARSVDGRTWPESDVVTIPFPSVQTMDSGDGGIYCFGGAYGQYGAVYFVKA